MSVAVILTSYRESPMEMDMLVNGQTWTNIGGLYRVQVQAVTPGHEAMYGFQWLMSVLSVDATLLGFAPGGVWRSLADAGTATPFVILAYQAGSDVLTMNAVRLMTTHLYQVKAVGPASMNSQILSAASRIDALIGSPPTGGSV